MASMKALPVLLALVFLSACDQEKLAGIKNESSSNSTPGPVAAATPKPTPKKGDWMLKNYKNPLDKK